MFFTFDARTSSSNFILKRVSRNISYIFKDEDVTNDMYVGHLKSFRPYQHKLIVEQNFFRRLIDGLDICKP